VFFYDVVFSFWSVKARRGAMLPLHILLPMTALITLSCERVQKLWGFG